LNPSELRAIIPVGGEAKRLKPLTAEVSKAVVRIFCKPLVEFAMAELAQQGVRNFVMGVKGYVNYVSLMDYLKDGVGFSADYGISPRVHIKYQPNVEDVGSADSVRINMEYFDIDGPVIVLQGDNLFDLDLGDLLAFHEKRKAAMTVVLTPVADVEGYGVADVGDEGRIRRFVEKPARGEAPSNLANAGIYLLSPSVRKVFDDPRVLEMIRGKKRLDFGMDFIPFMTDNGYPVYGYTMKGEWFDVGTPRGYLSTMEEVLGGHLLLPRRTRQRPRTGLDQGELPRVGEEEGCDHREGQTGEDPAGGLGAHRAPLPDRRRLHHQELLHRQLLRHRRRRDRRGVLPDG
jgi:NDP-sugar pyrophosphorylase family protein